MRDQIKYDRKVFRQDEMKTTCPLSLEDKAAEFLFGLIN